jgi:hypothetical protein
MKPICSFLFAMTSLIPAARGEIKLDNGIVEATWNDGEHGPSGGKLLCHATGQTVS